MFAIKYTLRINLVIVLFHASCLAQQRQPNFIFIFTDDQQYNAFGASGNNVILTPALDKLSGKGLLFKNANVVFSLCSPSRAAALTGRYGSANGVLELGSGLNEGEKTLANYLKEKGYQTSMFGKWHLDQTPEELGFNKTVYFNANGTYYGRKIYDEDSVVYPKIHCDSYCGMKAVETLRDYASGEKPFFMFFCTQTPHMDHRHTWPAMDSTKEKYQLDRIPVPANHLDDLAGKPGYLHTVRNRAQAAKYGYPDSLAIQSHTLDYYAVLTEMDQVIGALLDEFYRLALDENTYIIFMSDNGWMLGDHGFTSKVLPYRPSTHVPMIITGPEINPGISEAMVLNIDVLPTVLDLAHINIPANVHGKSLQRLLFRAREDVREWFVYEGLGTYGGTKPNLTVISKEYRYIQTYKNEKLDSILFHELYNQQNDPDEMENLADNPAFESYVKKFAEFIENHQKSMH
ncbi:sulfatase-like hydrolase/transferase [Fulvivirgaceae bacterium BMA12]|uniref:Sulfatase-like hydrolase/transferase n=1 Tax=Agaribacillus aureus TaxID=3051825 RepID=A0ABT8L9B7_9BACT|nr:sulfatase-like hydrolase/transferase [Fulvivirgaceae bacterium BMA12]